MKRAILVINKKLPDSVWIGIFIVSLVGLATVIYFIYISLFFHQSICYSCLLVWASTLVIVPISFSEAVKTGWLGKKLKNYSDTFSKYWWVFTKRTARKPTNLFVRGMNCH